MGVIVKEKVKGSGEWWIFIHHNGKKNTKKIGDQALAETVAQEMRAHLALKDFGFMAEKKDPVPTFKEAARLWLAEPQNWRESTRETYIFNLEKHIFPKIGKKPVNTLTRKRLKAFFNGLTNAGISPNTVALIRAPIQGVLCLALDEEWIEFNPLHNLTIKNRKSQTIVQPLTDHQADQLLDQAKIFMSRYYYPHLLCSIRTGIRLGELQALTWDDLDVTARILDINRSYRRGRITTPKNHKTRRVDITPHLAQTLKAHQTAQKKAALKGGYKFSKYIFANRKGNILDRETYKNALNRCLHGAGLARIRIHDLRHTYATIRLLRGHNIGDVSYQLGHSSIKITYDIYGHWMPGKFKNEVDQLDISTAPDCPQTAPKNEGV